jgi:hypothetical protein
MVNGIAGGGSASIAAVGIPAGLLAADLSKCQVQLSDWVHCASASTPEGQAKIKQISQQIGAIEAKIRVAMQAASRSRPAAGAQAPGAAAQTPERGAAVAAPAPSPVPATPSVASVPAPVGASRTGGHVDLYA